MLNLVAKRMIINPFGLERGNAFCPGT